MVIIPANQGIVGAGYRQLACDRLLQSWGGVIVYRRSVSNQTCPQTSRANGDVRLRLRQAVLVCLICQGCHGIAELGPCAMLTPPALDPALPTAAPPAETLLPNPLAIPVTDFEFFWNQLIDTIDDYFDVQSEQRVQLVGNVATEGRIETQPQPGATILEPWLWDSTPGFERWQSTLQSIRRKATITVRPQGTHYFVQVVVEKALEDVAEPAQGTPGSTLPRNDTSLLRIQDQQDQVAPTLGWIAIGRDLSLEQEILREIMARLTHG